MSSSNGANSVNKSDKTGKEDSYIKSHKEIEGFTQWIEEDDARHLALVDVYSDKTVKGDSVNGWKIVEDYNYKNTGFKAKLYEKDGNFAFVTAGTNPLSGQDWKTNLLQQMGKETEQYEQSLAIAKELAKKHSGHLIFIGHSLGGGLASANSRATGVDAITFNSSALSARYNNNLYNSKIAAYINNGDILDYTNTVLLRQKVEGTIIRQDVIESKLPNLQGVSGTGFYQAARGIMIHLSTNVIK